MATAERHPAPDQSRLVRFPVSVKGVVVRDGRVLLLENERAEWELPGGRLEPDEQPETCVVREIREETGWTVTAGPLLDSWLYRVGAGPGVVIITYGCLVVDGGAPVVSAEHRRIGLFTEDDVRTLPMPEGYRRSIAAWYAGIRDHRTTHFGRSVMARGTIAP